MANGENGWNFVESLGQYAGLNEIALTTPLLKLPVTCEKCHQRQATERWAADELARTHGWIQQWCKRCCLEAQAEYAMKIIKNLAGVLLELKAAGGEASGLHIYAMTKLGEAHYRVTTTFDTWDKLVVTVSK